MKPTASEKRALSALLNRNKRPASGPRTNPEQGALFMAPRREDIYGGNLFDQKKENA